MMGLSNHLGAALPKYPIQDVPTTFNEYWTWADPGSGAEAMDPFDYFKFRYYERWLAGIAAFFIEKGYLSEEELASRTKELTADQAPPSVAILPAIDEQIGNYLRHGRQPAPRRRASEVRRRRHGPDYQRAGGRTPRLPGFLRGRIGTVERWFRGRLRVTAGTTGDGIGDPMPVYIVEFSAAGAVGNTCRAGPGDDVRQNCSRHTWREPNERPVCVYPPDRERSSGAKVAALESLLIEKGVITGQTADAVLAYFRVGDDTAERQEDRREGLDRPRFPPPGWSPTPRLRSAELDLPDGMAGAEGNTCGRRQ